MRLAQHVGGAALVVRVDFVFNIRIVSANLAARADTIVRPVRDTSRKYLNVSTRARTTVAFDHHRRLFRHVDGARSWQPFENDSMVPFVF